MRAGADDVSEVNRLFTSGQTAEAMLKVDQFLAIKPKDPQLRFLKGVMLAEGKRTAEAIAQFAAITEEYPDLPEPYNNLAVLYASEGQYDKARNALEAAVRSNPGYATAQENLGDVYAKLAAQAYARAQALDPGNASLTPKLVLMRNLFTPKASELRSAAGTRAGKASAP